MTALASEWRPISPEQEAFLSSPAQEVFFGGAAGPGKTACLSMEALRQIHHPQYNGILFRRTYPMLEGADGLIARTLLWYPAYGGSYNISKHVWTFPSGAKIFLAHLEHDTDLQIYQGWQLQFIGFDELTQFLENQYLYLLSRNRTDEDTGLRCYMRSAGNPGGVGNAWVKRRFIRAGVTNRIGYFAKVDGVDTVVPKSHPDAISRSFIPAKLSSNPKLSPEYRAKLRQLDAVPRAQLEDGDWDAESRDDKIYPDWSDANISAEADYIDGYPVYWAVDDGYTNPRSILLIQERPFAGEPDNVCVFAEYHATQTLALSSIETILGTPFIEARTGIRKQLGDHVESWPYPIPDLAYYDPAAAELSGVLQSVGIATWGGYNNLAEGVKVVRRFILDANGRRRLRVHPRCTHLIEAMPEYRKDDSKKVEQGGDPVPAKNGLEHPLDSLRYFIATRYL